MIGPKYFLWGASVRGPLHKKQGKPNQDRYLCRRFFWGELLVVADGLGSKTLSHIGAAMICKAAVIELKINPFNFDHDDFTQRLYSRWLNLVEKYGVEKCGCTCLYCVRIRDKWFLGQIGDGEIIAIKEDSQVAILAEDKENGFANITKPLGVTFRAKDWRYATFSTQKVDTVFLSTDGISEDLKPELKINFVLNLIKFFHRKFSWFRYWMLKRMLNNWPVPSHSDDKTFAVIYHKKEK